MLGSRSFKGANGKFTLKCFAWDHPEGFLPNPELPGTEQFSLSSVLLHAQVKRPVIWKFQG